MWLRTTSRLAAARAERQERAAVNWLTFIPNQFTAAPAQIKVRYPILGPGCGKPMLHAVSEITFTNITLGTKCL
jgi:hypothetical protein